MSEVERERDLYKALAKAYREDGITALAGYIRISGLESNRLQAKTRAEGVFDATRIRVEAEHAAPKPTDNFAACWSPPGWDERERED